MNKTNYLTFSGVLMGLAGICMLISESRSVGTSKILVSSMFAISGVLNWMFSSANKQHKLTNQYHMIQGVGAIVFAVIIGLSTNDLSCFLRHVVYFMLFFGLVEFIYAFLTLNSSQSLNVSILISRFIAGLLNVTGAVLILATSVTNEISSLMIAGSLVFLGGLSFIIFSIRLRKITVV